MTVCFVRSFADHRLTVIGLALTLFKDLFLKCNDRVVLVKTWLTEQPSETEMWLDQIVYDRALQLASP